MINILRNAHKMRPFSLVALGLTAACLLFLPPVSAQQLAKRLILKDGSYLDRELSLGVFVLALPNATGSDVTHIVTATGGTGDFAVRPSQADHEALTDIRIGKVADGSEKGLGLVVHAR